MNTGKWIFPFVILFFVTTCANTKSIGTEKEVFKSAKSSDDVSSWENYLRAFPEGKYVKIAREAICKKFPQNEPWKSVAFGIMDLDDIDGATFDPNNRQLRIWGKGTKKLPPLLLDDFVMALKIIGEGKEIGVSIDPPKKKGKEWSPDEPMHNVVRYIPHSTYNTHLGSVMYEVDRRLKSLSMGQDNITGELVSSDVPGFMTIPDRIRKNITVYWETGQFSRLWFMPDEPEILCEGYSVRFGKIRMNLKPEGKHILVRDFAAHMTDYFVKFAQDDIVFAELIRLHKLIALARWLRDGEFPVDDFVRNYPLLKIKTPLETPAKFITCRKTKKEIIKGEYKYVYEYVAGLVGGVAFPRNNYMIPKVSPIKERVKSDLPRSRSSFSSNRWGPPRYGNIDPDAPLPYYSKIINNARPTKRTWAWDAKINGKQYHVVAIPMIFNRKLAIK